MVKKITIKYIQGNRKIHMEIYRFLLHVGKVKPRCLN